MNPKIRQVLRRSTFLVRCMRTFRQARLEWIHSPDELREERQNLRRLEHRQQAITAYLANHPVSGLTLGAGVFPLEGWLNSDLEPVNDQIIFLDATEPFPFEDNSLDYVYAEHMIEHIPYPKALGMLAEIGRVLKPGGRVRLATPDLQVVMSLLDEPRSPQARHYIETYACQLLGLYSSQPNPYRQHEPDWNIDPDHIHASFPDPGRDAAVFIVNLLFYGFGHRFLYNLATLQAALEFNGFQDIRQYRPGQSDDPRLRGIERHGLRFADESINQFETLVVEAIH